MYFVHNRVESIYSMGNLIQRLVPEARVVDRPRPDGGRRARKGACSTSWRTSTTCCSSTTIVENGLDIPNANTIVINRADRYGLSQLYQLRGRVGRSDRPAYAYLLIPPEEALSPVARKRLAAIKEFSELGSGFRVAALDLEIRGAGNLLGGEQSGTIDAVGFEMYMKLLEETIRELKGEDLEDDVRATVNLQGRLPARRGLRARHEPAADDLSPDGLGANRRGNRAAASTRCATATARRRPPCSTWPTSAGSACCADGLGIETIDRDGPLVVFKFRERTKVDPMRIIALVQERGDLQLVPPSTVKLDLKARRPAAGSPEPAGRSRQLQKLAEGRKPKAIAKLKRAPAWWTARATAGEVTPGFTKAEILRAAPEDPGRRMAS